MSTPTQEAPAFGTPGWTPEQLQQAAAQVQPPPLATGPNPDALGNAAATGIPTIADVEALVTKMQTEMEARLAQRTATLEAEIARLKSGQAPTGIHPLIGSATALKNLVEEHLGPVGVRGKDDLMRLLDDVVDAASNAFDSGDTTTIVSLAGKAAKALERINPGPGEHAMYRQAVHFATTHIPDAAETITGPNPNRPVAQVSGGAPVQVVAGSVTG